MLARLTERPGVVLTVACILFLFPSGHCLAQVTTTGTIAGTVRDPSGANVSAADVTAIDTDTGTQSTTQTNIDGSFIFPSLPVGIYTVTVSRVGFKTSSTQGIALHPGIVTSVNATLQIGSVSTSVTVSAGAEQVQTATPEISNEVSSTQADELPLDGRNFSTLSMLMPGITNVTPDTALGQGGLNTSNVMSVNGTGISGSMYYVDGIWDMNTGDMASLTVIPNPDEIQEVRVMQNNYGVRYSLMGGAAVLISTKSGTDTFHGSLWEYLRNNDLDARNFFAPTTPALHQNIFGGTIGGPLFIPGHRPAQPRTFFFFSEQWVRQSAALTLLGPDPTEAMREGTFNTPITNPLTGQPFPQPSPGVYQITQSMINPQALALLNAVAPLPNNGTGFLNYLNNRSPLTKTRDDEVKIDRTISPRIHLMAEYLRDWQVQNYSYDTFLASPFPTQQDPIITENQLAQIQLTATLSPNLVNTTSISMNNYVASQYLTGTAYLNQVPNFSENLPFKGGFESNRLPEVDFAGGWGSIGTPQAVPLIHAGDLEDSFTDDLSWLRGNHSIETGLNIVLGNKRQTNFAFDEGDWFFSGAFTGNPIADYLLGDATTFYQQSTETRPYVHYKIVSPYIQDRWKATRRLTLTAGLRIEYLPEPHAQHGYEGAFNPQLYNSSEAPIVNSDGTITETANYNPLNGVVINGVNGVPLNFTNTYEWYWGPNVGFALDIFGDGKTALRGGYGITYTRTPASTDCSYYCSNNIPLVDSISLVSPSFPNPIGAAVAPPSAPTFANNTAFNLRAGTITSYSLSLEHRFSDNWLVSIAGVGDLVQHIGDYWNINQPLPDQPYGYNPLINSDPALPGAVGIFPYVYAPYQGYAAMDTYVSNDFTHWNALEIAVRHPTGHNLMLNLAYTWQHGLSTELSQDPFDGTSNMQNIYEPGQNYGNSALNVPQILTFSYIYNFPWYKNVGGWKGQLLGGWRYAGMTIIQSGFSLNPGLSVAFQGLATRPDRTAVPVSGPKTQQEWFNTAAFAVPAYGYFGNAAPGSILGPGLVDFDMALYKDFHLTERDIIQFRAEAFNIFNHTNFSGVSTTVGAGNYGQVTSALDPRIMEFALRFQF
jgi:hypothetical protein